MKADVRRANEWDAPTMLKVYQPYVENTHVTPDTVCPTLREYIERIDRYTYGRGWLIAEIDTATAGFCLLTDRDVDEDEMFTADIQLYVAPQYQRRGVGDCLYDMMLQMMHIENYKRVTAHINLPNPVAVAFHEKWGFTAVAEENGVLRMEKEITQQKPDAKRFTKPFLIFNDDYEKARRHARARIREV